MVKNPSANAGDIRDATLTPGSGRSPGRGHGNPLQYCCLENPLDRGAWRATVAKSLTQLKQLSACTHTHMFKYMNIFLRKSWVLMTGTPVAHSPAQAEWLLSGNTTRLSP